MGGALGIEGSRRIVEAIEVAVRERCPVIGVWHSGGAKLADGVESMDGVGQMFAAMTRASGRVPQISVVVGPAAGAAAYGPALTDMIIMAPAGRVFIRAALAWPISSPPRKPTPTSEPAAWSRTSPGRACST
jgi:acetyl-CoA/propionyl-CoA carboxylase carboxyl transferase subunit